MNLWAITALLIAAVAGALSAVEWSSIATPYLSALAIFFALLSLGAIGAQYTRQ